MRSRIRISLGLLALAVPLLTRAAAAERFFFSDGPALIGTHGYHALSYDLTVQEGSRAQTVALLATFQAIYVEKRDDGTSGYDGYLDASLSAGKHVESGHVKLDGISRWSTRPAPKSVPLHEVWRLAHLTEPFMVTASDGEWSRGELHFADRQGSVDTMGPCQGLGYRGLRFRVRRAGTAIDDEACISPEVPLPLDLLAHENGQSFHYVLRRYTGDGPARGRSFVPPYVYFYGRNTRLEPGAGEIPPHLPVDGWIGGTPATSGKRAVIFCDSWFLLRCKYSVALARAYVPGRVSVVIAAPKEDSRAAAAREMEAAGVPVLAVVERGNAVIEDWRVRQPETAFLIATNGAIAGSYFGMPEYLWPELRRFAGEGTLAPAVIRRTWMKKRSQLMACFAKEKARHPAHGKLVFDIAIAPDEAHRSGKVVYVSKPDYKLDDDGAVENCVRDRLWTLTFPAPSGGAVTASIPLSL